MSLIISLLLVTSIASAKESSELRLMKEEIDEIKSCLDFYDRNTGWETYRLRQLETRADRIEKYLDITDADPGFMAPQEVKVGRIEKLAEELGYTWKSEPDESKEFPKWVRKK